MPQGPGSRAIISCGTCEGQVLQVGCHGCQIRSDRIERKAVLHQFWLIFMAKISFFAKTQSEIDFHESGLQDQKTKQLPMMLKIKTLLKGTVMVVIFK
jgi:hypothetical protein